MRTKIALAGRPERDSVTTYRWESGIVLLLLAGHPGEGDAGLLLASLSPGAQQALLSLPPPPAAIATRYYVTLAKYPAL